MLEIAAAYADGGDRTDSCVCLTRTGILINVGDHIQPAEVAKEFVVHVELVMVFRF